MTLPVPLCVRLKTARADLHVTRDVRDLSFSDRVPGGFDRCEISLDRPLSVDPAEIAMFGELWVQDGRNASIQFYGRLDDPSRGAGPDGQIWNLTAVGSAAHASDRTVPLIYIDRSLERWVGPSEYSAKAFRCETTEYDPGTGPEPALKISVEQGATPGTGADGLGDFIYKAIKECGQYIARVRYDDIEGFTDASWFARISNRLDTGGGTVEGQRSVSTAAGGVSGYLGSDWTTATDYNVTSIRLDRDGGATTGGLTTWMTAWGVAVRAVLMDALGAHITTGYTVNYVLVHEIVKDLLGRLLNKFDGANASIDTSSTYQIDQLAYPDGATPEQILADLILFEALYYWAAWEDRYTAGKAFFEWRQWPTTVRYEASAADGFDSPSSGAEVYNEVVVRWRDALGRPRRTVRTQTVQALTDAGLTRTTRIDLGDDVGTSANAVRAGDQFLAEHASAPNAGTLTVQRPILDLETGRTVMPWEIRSGNLIRVRDVLPRIDALNATARDAVTIFRIVEKNYSVSDCAAQLTLDAPVRGLSQIVRERSRTRRR